MDALQDQICFQLETLFKQFYGEDYRLPYGLSIEDVGEHIYSGVADLAALQQILVDILSQGVQSPHFENAVNFFIHFSI